MIALSVQTGTVATADTQKVWQLVIYRSGGCSLQLPEFNNYQTSTDNISNIIVLGRIAVLSPGMSIFIVEDAKRRVQSDEPIEQTISSSFTERMSSISDLIYRRVLRPPAGISMIVCKKIFTVALDKTMSAASISTENRTMAQLTDICCDFFDFDAPSDRMDSCEHGSTPLTYKSPNMEELFSGLSLQTKNDDENSSFLHWGKQLLVTLALGSLIVRAAKFGVYKAYGAPDDLSTNDGLSGDDT
jgi:hypothetical protein